MIKVERKKRGMTQKELANYVGVTQSYIAKIENNSHRHKTNLTAAKIVKLSTALDLEPELVFLFVISR